MRILSLSSRASLEHHLSPQQTDPLARAAVVVTAATKNKNETERGVSAVRLVQRIAHSTRHRAVGMTWARVPHYHMRPNHPHHCTPRRKPNSVVQPRDPC